MFETEVIKSNKIIMKFKYYSKKQSCLDDLELKCKQEKRTETL